MECARGIWGNSPYRGHVQIHKHTPLTKAPEVINRRLRKHRGKTCSGGKMCFLKYVKILCNTHFSVGSQLRLKLN